MNFTSGQTLKDCLKLDWRVVCLLETANPNMGAKLSKINLPLFIAVCAVSFFVHRPMRYLSALTIGGINSKGTFSNE